MGLFSSIVGGVLGLAGGKSKTTNTSTTKTTSTSDSHDVAAAENAKVIQYLPTAKDAKDVTIESLDSDLALASIAAVLDTTQGAVEALKDNSKQAFGLVNEQARSGSERLAQNTINGVVAMVIAFAIAYAIANRKGK